MLPKYRDILKHEADLDILIFSGDVDGIVPVIGTRRWVASLQLPVVKEWRPWYSHTGELCVPQQDHVVSRLLIMRYRNAVQKCCLVPKF